MSNFHLFILSLPSSTFHSVTVCKLYSINIALKKMAIDQGPVSERRLSENSEYVNPEMRETLGFPFQNGRFVKPGKTG